MMRSSRKSYGNVFVQMPSRQTKRSRADDASTLKTSSLLVTTEASSSDSSASVSSVVGAADVGPEWFSGEKVVAGDGLVVVMVVVLVATSKRRPSSSCGRMNRRDDNRNENMYSWGMDGWMDGLAFKIVEADEKRWEFGRVEVSFGWLGQQQFDVCDRHGKRARKREKKFFHYKNSQVLF